MAGYKHTYVCMLDCIHNFFTIKLDPGMTLGHFCTMSQRHAHCMQIFGNKHKNSNDERYHVKYILTFVNARVQSVCIVATVLLKQREAHFIKLRDHDNTVKR